MSFGCACASDDCRVNGCQRARRLRRSSPQGWECPKCGAVMAPGFPSCVRCVGRVSPSPGITTPPLLPPIQYGSGQSTPSGEAYTAWNLAA